MRTIRLYGELGKSFGTTHHYDVKTPAEAVRALCANKKGFRKFMLESEKFGIGFKVINGNSELETASDALHPASGEIKFIPVIIGANAEARVILGAALIVVGVVMNAYVPGSGTIPIGIGISLALGGVIQMISPPPQIGELPDRPENKPSFAFNGPINTTIQGHPVAIGYGRLIVGSAVISAAITLEQIKSGFKRIKAEHTRSIVLVRNTGDIFTGPYTPTGLSYPGPIPANFFKREFVSTNPLVLGQTQDLYTYYYYQWELVEI